MRKIREVARKYPAAVLARKQSWLRIGVALLIVAILLPGGTATATPPRSFASHAATLSTASSSPSASGLDASGDFTATGSVSGSSFAADGGLFFAAEEVDLTNTVNLNALTIVVTVAAPNGETFGSQRVESTQPVTLTQSFSTNGSQIIYTYTLAPGQRLRAGSTLKIVSQFSGIGEYHLFGGDSFAISAVSAPGAASSVTGNFSPPADYPPPPSGPPVIAAGIVDPGSSNTTGQEDVIVNSAVRLTALAITITVDEADGPAYQSEFNTFSTALTMSKTDDGLHITYTFTFVPTAKTPFFEKGQGMAVAQFSLPGVSFVSHNFTNDSYEVSYTTSAGVPGDVTGSFPSGPPTPTPTATATPTPPPFVSNDFFSASGNDVDTGTSFYLNDVLSLTNTVFLTGLTTTVTIPKTPGISFGAKFNNFAAGAVTMSFTDTGSLLIYTYNLAPGQKLAPGNGMLQAQFNNATGQAPPLGGTFAITAASGSGVRTALGSFPAGLPPTATATPAAISTATPAPPPPAANTDTPALPPPAASTETPMQPSATPASPSPDTGTGTSRPSSVSSLPPAVATSFAVRGVPVSDQNVGSASTPVPGKSGRHAPRRAARTTRARSKPRRPTPASLPAACTTSFLVLTALSTHSTRIFAAGPVALARSPHGHTGTAATHRVQTTVVFDNGQGIRLTTGPLVATLACDHLAPAPLHGRARAGSARRDRRQVSLRGAAFTLTIQSEPPRPRGHAGATYSLRVQIPRIHYDRTFTRLKGTVTPVKPAATKHPTAPATATRQPAATATTASISPTATPVPPTTTPVPPTATPRPTDTPTAPATATPAQPPGQPIVVAAPLRLSATTVKRGHALTAMVTLRNSSSSSVTLTRIVIAGRPPGGTKAGGPYDDFGAVQNVTLRPGQSVTVRQSRRFAATDPVGSWYSYVTYQTADGQFHDASADITFTVVSA